MSKRTSVVVLTVVLVFAGCGFNANDGEPGKAALIMLNSESHQLTVRNTGDTDLVDCEVRILSASSPIEFDRPDPNVVKIAVLQRAESIDIPLSTFPAYRDRSIFRQISPFASLNCHERTINGKTHFSSVAF